MRGVQTRKGAMVSERGDGGDLGDGVCVGGELASEPARERGREGDITIYRQRLLD